MLNITKLNDNEIKIVYNTVDGVKEEIKDYPVLKVIKSDDGDYKDLTGTEYNLITNTNDNENSILAYTCLRNKYNKIDYFLNTVLQLENKFIKDLVSPELIFYDIETDSTDPKTSKITSIAWIDKENKEYCYIRDVDGSETEIIQSFLNYCKDNKVMGLVGHNSFGFDNKVMIRRCKDLKITDYSIFYYDCNLDTMILSNFLQYTPNKMISLNNLAKLLKINDSKTDTGIYNPINLYHEALKNEDKLKLFREYNIQDVHLCKACFEAMNSLKQLEELFKQTLCPLKKLSYNQSLLNSFTCKYLYSNNIVVPKSVNTPIEFKNKGGYNYYKESKQLQVYKNVLVLDIVSYYPHILMLIGADPTNEYENIDRTTGTINKFKDNLINGILGQLSKLLYESRARIKKEMKQTKDPELKEQLNHEQQAKKIVVNSLYGVLSQKNGYYVLKNELIGATITALGRDLLKNIVKNFNGVYAKTDSIFIPLKENDKPKIILNQLNIYINKFFKEKYNLENTTSNGQLVRFERDNILDYLIVKDKNNYVKISNGKFSFKGGSFTNAKMSPFENELTNNVLKELLKDNNIDIVDNAIKFTEQQLQNQDLNYFSKLVKLSKKQENNKIMKGRVFMEDNNIPYTFGFKYLSCRVEHPEYDYILYPPEYNPDLTIKHEYVYELLCKQLKNIKIINHKKYNKLFKRFKNSNNQIKITDKTKPVKTVKNKQFKNIKNKYIKKLNELIPDTAKYYNKGLLGLIPVKAKSKEAYVKGFKYTEKYINNYDITQHIKNDNNIGLCLGYKGLEVLDIDGAKGICTPEENRKLKNYIFNILKKIDYPFIIQKSQSGGHHLIYCDNNGGCKLNHIKFSDNLQIDGINKKTLEKLQGFSLGACIDTRETRKQMHYIVLAPSKIIDKDTKEKRYYKLLSDNYRWEQIFNNPIQIQDKIENVLEEHGFIIGEKPKETKKFKTETNQKPKQLKELNNNEIEKITKNFIEILKEAHKGTGKIKKYETAFSMGGHFSNNITEKSTKAICDKVVKNEISKTFDKEDVFYKAVLNNYTTDVIEKTGINTIKEAFKDNTTVLKCLKNITKITVNKRKTKSVINYTSKIFNNSNLECLKKYTNQFGTIIKKGNTTYLKTNQIEDLKNILHDIIKEENLKEDNDIYILIIELLNLLKNEPETENRLSEKNIQLKIKIIHEELLRNNVILEFLRDNNLKNNFITILKDNENIETYVTVLYQTLEKLFFKDDDVVKYINDLLKQSEIKYCINDDTIDKIKEDKTDYDFYAYYSNSEIIIKMSNYLNKIEKIHQIDNLLSLFENDKLHKARKKLAEIMTEELNIIRRKRIGTTYELDKNSNAYEKIKDDDLYTKINDFIGQKHRISDDDIKGAIKSLYHRIEPDFNFIKLKDCIIDMRTVEKVESDEKPKLCLLSLPYTYNPEAKGKLTKQFLETSLAESTPEKTQEKIQGVFELLGYLLTSGNNEQLLIFITGIQGSGKSIMGAIITALVGGIENTCDVKLEKINSEDSHTTSAFIDSHINLVGDLNQSHIKDIGMIKQATGNDSILVNPKHKDPVMLEPEEVPKSVVMCNNLPIFNNIDDSLMERIINVQHKKSFRGTKEQIKNLDKLITENDEEMEYILYNSLEAYKPIALGEKGFILKKSRAESLKIIEMNTDPIKYYLRKLVIHNPDQDNNNEIVIVHDLRVIIKELAKADGVNVKLDTNDNLPNARTILNRMNNLFELFEKEEKITTKPKRINKELQRYYNNVSKTNFYYECENKYIKNNDNIIKV